MRWLASFLFVFALAILLSLSGCADAPLRNRAYCSLAGDEFTFVSWWGMFGISAKIENADRDIACKKGAPQ